MEWPFQVIVNFNTKVYKVTTLQDAEHLQEDLQILSEWTKLWQMKVNVDKCAVLWCTRSMSPIQHNYTLSGHEIVIKDSPYSKQ